MHVAYDVYIYNNMYTYNVYIMYISVHNNYCIYNIEYNYCTQCTSDICCI